MQEIAGSPVKHISGLSSPVKQVPCGTALPLVAEPIHMPKMISGCWDCFPEHCATPEVSIQCMYLRRWKARGSPQPGILQHSGDCMEEPVESLDAKGSPAGAVLVARPAWGQCCAVLWVGAWRGAGLSAWAWPHMSSWGWGSERGAVCSGPGRQRCVFVFCAISRTAFVLLVKRFRR